MPWASLSLCAVLFVASRYLWTRTTVKESHRSLYVSSNEERLSIVLETTLLRRIAKWLLTLMEVVLRWFQDEGPPALNVFPTTGLRKALHGFLSYVGVCSIPARVFVGDSHNISLTLRRSEGSSPVRSFRVQDTDSGKQLDLTIKRSAEAIEIELLAAGIRVAGSKVQRNDLSEPVLEFLWNCNFDKSGDHRIALDVREICGDRVAPLGTIEKSIRVTQIDGLTKRQVQLVSIFVGAIGVIPGTLGVIKVLKELKWL